ncbi:DNA polymerase [Patescibacteria group bacterium]
MPAKKQNKKRLVLLDAHAIIHRAYHALPDFSTAAGEPTGGLYGVAAMLIKIINELKPDYIVACYDLPKPTFRHEAYDGYKAGRKKSDDELVSQIIRSRDIFAAFNIPIYEKEGFEADDILGTIVEQLRKDKNTEIVIASGDMDTLQLVDNKKVQVYTLRKGLSDTIMYDEDRVVERFGFAPGLLVDFKGLRGDPSDNIIGIAGIGEKTATTLITKFGTIEDIYKKLKKNKTQFEEAGIKPRIIGLLEEGEEEALFSKTLATIRLDAPIDFVLPDKSWEEGFEIGPVEKIFAELEFRTLLARAKQMFGNGESADVEPEEEEETKEEVDEREIKEIGIALWLLKSDITNPTLEDIYQFSGTKTFAEAKKKILADLKKEKLQKVYEEIELPLIDIIEAAQDRGILVDVKYLKKLSKKYHAKLEKIQANIWREAGEEFNINSPKQVGEILFDKMEVSTKGLKKTAGGARSTKESELLKLKEDYPIVADILAYRELQKLVSTYVDTIPNLVDKENRLHTTLNQTGTTTGRFSSTNPNIQNIPVRDGDEIRDGFIAQKGHTLLALDYSQIEMRILAHLCGSETLIDVFKKGEDVHSAVAMHVFGVEDGDVTKDMRRKAKVINFGIVYGMGVTALRANLGGTRAEAQEFYNNYFEKFPRVAEYFDTVKSDAAKTGLTTTLFGRKRHFEGINSKAPFIRAMAQRQAMNAPIQGTAADVIKLAMKKVDEEIKKAKLDKKAHLLLQVHDELIFEVEDSEVKKAEKVIQDAMENAAELKVPLVVNASSGQKWGSLK